MVKPNIPLVALGVSVAVFGSLYCYFGYQSDLRRLDDSLKDTYQIGQTVSVPIEYQQKFLEYQAEKGCHWQKFNENLFTLFWCNRSMRA